MKHSMSSKHSLISKQSSFQRVGNYSYNSTDVLGKGAFSTVYLGRSLLTTEKIAVKVVHLKRAQQQEVLKNIKNQLYILSNLPPHPNVLSPIHLQQQGSVVYIVTQLCQQKLNLKNTDDIKLNSVVSGIINGLKHLYKHGVVHRDIKLQNIMLKNGVPKIIDFGFAKVTSNPSDVMVEQLGTPIYMSPQLLQKKFYTSKCDIWSFGILLYELLYKTSPFLANNLKQLVQKVKTQVPIIPKGRNPIIEALIQKCLVKDEGRRLSWKGLFQLGEKLTKQPVKQPETVYEYILQWIGIDDAKGGLMSSCWPNGLTRSTVF